VGTLYLFLWCRQQRDESERASPRKIESGRERSARTALLPAVSFFSPLFQIDRRVEQGTKLRVRPAGEQPAD